MASRPSLYIETSAWSAVVDPRIPGRQKITRTFFKKIKRRYRLQVSDLALEEIREHPRPDLRRRILRYLWRRRPKVLGPNARVREATRELMSMGRWGPRVLVDVTQVGYALVGKADALVTWNQKDLARREVRRVIQRYCRERNRPMMRIGTPQEVARWLGVKM